MHASEMLSISKGLPPGHTCCICKNSVRTWWLNACSTYMRTQGKRDKTKKLASRYKWLQLTLLFRLCASIPWTFKFLETRLSSLWCLNGILRNDLAEMYIFGKKQQWVIKAEPWNIFLMSAWWLFLIICIDEKRLGTEQSDWIRVYIWCEKKISRPGTQL
jgi:hypothetical protein